LPAAVLSLRLSLHGCLALTLTKHALRRHTGSALVNQGHVAIEGRHGKLLQADFFPGPNGINELRTHRETDSLLRKYDGEGWEYVVAPESWLK
jgi:hypothetical protein